MKTYLSQFIAAALFITPVSNVFAKNDRVDPLKIEKIAKEDNFNGVALVAIGGKISLLRDYHKDDMLGEAHNIGTKFNIGSVGKVFTAVAIGQLVDKGVISFDDSVRKYIKDLPASYDNVKISHLLTHMSGIGRFFQPKYRDRIYSFKTLSDIMEIILEEPNLFSPGEKMQYSNSGFVVLGVLIEAVTGQSYEEYIQENIFDPSRMTSTGFTFDDNTATNYSRGMMRRSSDGEATPLKTLKPSRTRRALPAGGMFSTAEDLYNFAIALTNNELMSAKMTKVMITAKPGTIGTVQSTGAKVGYGYGFNIADDGMRVGHGGGGPGINAELRIWPETQNIIITLTNLDPPLASEFADNIEESLAIKKTQE